jgi:hypothetical protein
MENNMPIESLLAALRVRFAVSRERAAETALVGPNSYGAGYDLGYADALGELIEQIEDGTYAAE